MKRFPLLFLALFLILSGHLAAQGYSLAERLNETVENDEATSRTFVGMKVLDAETGKVLYARYEKHLFTPASNAKLSTSAASLAIWGPDRTFTTQVVARGRILNGVLEGDIVLVGGGDPVLKTADLRALARRVRQEWNVESIAGRVVIDDTLYAPRLKGPGWMWDDNPDTYSMSITSLMLNYNVLTLRLTEQNGRVAAALDPPSETPPIVNALRGLERPIVTRKPFTDVILVQPDPDGGVFQPSSFDLTMYQPSPWIAGVFTNMLKREGVDVRGTLLRPVDEQSKTILIHESPPLSEILALFNKPSENAIGEMLLHNLAIEEGFVPATWSDGARVISHWLTSEAGLEEGSFRVEDGSGLSRYNLITPEGTVRLLHYMWQHPSRVTFVRSLPIAGVDGTLQWRMTDTPAQGRVFAKTGTMSGVSCLSGYAQTQEGDWRIFSICMNGYVGSSAPARQLQDRLCAILVEPHE
ncbi:MAG: hypothetical protein PWP23_309 [Candidatus Sumerlaeota bacterium]|nr:hypothetical protein [Candidatus Sumerlaeota bacterium]